MACISEERRSGFHVNFTGEQLIIDVTRLVDSSRSRRR